MPLPNMVIGLSGWTVPVVLKTETVTTTDFVETSVVSETTIQAVIQPETPESLRSDNIDWSLKYVRIHSETALAVGQFVEFEAQDYKVISVTDYSAYGYYTAFGEQTRKATLEPPVVVTP